MKKRYVIGVDEAGRGPLAGPVVVGAVTGSNIKILKNIKDSKKLSARQRENWKKIIKNNFECHHVFISHKTIDKIRIHNAVNLGVEKVLQKFSLRPRSGRAKKANLILLDGSLRAPKKYKQKTIIRGDEKIPLIAAASIIAKTSRDRKMLALHKKFPQYCFDRHKGYGTKLHYKKLKKHGPCPIHRNSFLHLNIVK